MERIRLRTVDADAAYAEEKIGRELYSQLGGMTRVAEFRLDAVTRAASLYYEAVEHLAPESQVAANGLLVLQRTLLACEDFGSLAYALAEQPHWLRFTSYGAKDLDQVFSEFLNGQLDVRRLWTMPTDEALEEEPGWTRSERGALSRLREVTASTLRAEIEPVADFWLSHRRSIKNVMHGFSLVPACLLIDPPGAGALSKQVDLLQERPFAASFVSELDEATRTVTTRAYSIDLTALAIAAVSDIARTATALLARLADARRFAVLNRYGFVLRQEFLDQLDPEDQQLLAQKLVHDDDA